MTTADTGQPPFTTNGHSFASASALRAAHSDLLRRERAVRGTPAFVREVADFVLRGRATGKLIDSSTDERSACQSLLDYWASFLYDQTNQLPNTTLEPFDRSLAPFLGDALCPYRGLDAFREIDQHLFFGRRRKIEEWLQLLAERRFLPILGASGSGKSSLVLGGLIPALKNGALPGSQEWRYVPAFVPGSRPLINLAQALRPPGEATDTWVAQQAQLFQQDPQQLTRLLHNAAGTPAVLVIDQFEEVFTLCDDDAVRKAFISNLLVATRAPGPRHTVILTMRSDYENRVARIPTLQRLVEASGVRVTPLNASEIRDAILQPAALVGLKFEEGVVERLINDILDEPAALPLLQFTLLKLWDERDRNLVTMAAYRRLGGGRRALSNSADEVYEKLIPEEQVTARRILLRMVRPGEGLEVTSSRIRRDDLFTLSEARERVERVLKKLIDARLVRITAGATPADEQVEVAHEALIRNWPRLVDWLDAEREGLRERRRLTSAAEQWKQFDKDASTLWRGSLLDEALRLNYRDLTRDEKAFLRASLIAKEKEEQEKEHDAKEKEHARQLELVQARALLVEQERRAEAEHARAEAQNSRAEAERERAESQTVAARRLRLFSISIGIVLLLAMLFLAYIVLQQRQVANLNQQINDLDATARAAQTSGAVAATSLATAATFRSSLEQTAIALQATSTVVNVANSTSQALRATAQQQAIQAQTTGTAIAAVNATNEADKRKSATQLAELQTNGTAIAMARATTELDRATISTQLAVAQATGTAVTIAGATSSADLTHSSAQVAELTTQVTGLTTIISATTQAVNATSVALQNIATAQAIAAEAPNQTSVAAQTAQAAAEALAAQRQAEQQSAQAHLLAAQARAAGDPQLALLLAIEAAKRSGEEDVFEALEGAIWRVAPMGHGVETTSASWSPDSRLIVTTGNDSLAIIWDSQTGSQKLILRGHSAIVTSAAWSSDGSRIVTSSNDGTARIWDASTGTVLRVLNVGTVKVTSAAWSPDDSRIATTTDNQRIQIWNTQTGGLVLAFAATGDRLTRAAWSPSGDRFVTASADGAARVWDAAKGSQLQKISGPGAILSAAWNPTKDSQYIVTAGSDGNARIWDLSGDLTQPVQTLSGHTGAVNDAMWSPSGLSVATAGDDTTMRTWVSATGAQRSAFSGNTAPVLTAVWSPDIKWIVTAARDGSVRIFAVEFGDALAMAQGLATRTLTDEELNRALQGSLPAAPTATPGR